MEVNEALDRELIVERAEALRSWITDLHLSSRTSTALERELNGILANDPGGYINGQRPLAGLTIDAFIDELEQPGSGAVGQVRGIGPSALTELRAAISTRPPTDKASTNNASPDALLDDFEAPPDDYKAPQVTPEPAPKAPAEATPQTETTAEASPPPRRGRGRPPGSTRAARNGAATTPAAPVEADAAPPAPRRRGRPPKSAQEAQPAAAAPQPAAKSPVLMPKPLVVPPPPPAAPPAPTMDPALHQLVQIWPSLHPHARRAIVLYASTLLVEAAFDA